jgi:hypothetical protein
VVQRVLIFFMQKYAVYWPEGGAASSNIGVDLALFLWRWWWWCGGGGVWWCVMVVVCGGGGVW